MIEQLEHREGKLRKEVEDIEMAIKEETIKREMEQGQLQQQLDSVTVKVHKVVADKQNCADFLSTTDSETVSNYLHKSS